MQRGVGGADSYSESTCTVHEGYMEAPQVVQRGTYSRSATSTRRIGG